MKTIMGLDPGSRKTGFGVIEVGEKARVISHGVIDLPSQLSFAEKLVYLQTHLPESSQAVPTRKCRGGKNIFWKKCRQRL